VTQKSAANTIFHSYFHPNLAEGLAYTARSG